MNTVFQWQDGKGASVFLKPSGFTGSTSKGGEQGSNGLLMDHQGPVDPVPAWRPSRARRESGETFTTLADKYMGKRLNSPNDGVFKSNGDIYFTDPPYGRSGLNRTPPRSSSSTAVYRISAADGTLTLLTKEMTFPNGIALSPDEKTLYVANSDPVRAIWMAFPVKEDGTIGKGRVFADVTSSVLRKKRRARWHEGGCSRQPVRVWTRRRPGLRPGRHPSRHVRHWPGDRQLRFGEDGSVLYITADMYIGRVRLTTKGIGF